MQKTFTRAVLTLRLNSNFLTLTGLGSSVFSTVGGAKPSFGESLALRRLVAGGISTEPSRGLTNRALAGPDFLSILLGHSDFT